MIAKRVVDISGTIHVMTMILAERKALALAKARTHVTIAMMGAIGNLIRESVMSKEIKTGDKVTVSGINPPHDDYNGSFTVNGSIEPVFHFSFDMAIRCIIRNTHYIKKLNEKSLEDIFGVPVTITKNPTLGEISFTCGVMQNPCEIVFSFVVDPAGRQKVVACLQNPESFKTAITKHISANDDACIYVDSYSYQVLSVH